MITAKHTQKEDIDSMHKVFSMGFSDYMVNLNMTKERFIELFMNIEDNTYQQSLIAFDNSIPVGLMLGGIKTYENAKTLRCGTLAIDPNYRQKGVAQALFKKHLEIAKSTNCEQLFLEVIKGNEKAINFYHKQGYAIRYDIYYYQLNDFSLIKSITDTNIVVKRIDLSDAYQFYLSEDHHHINWQNDFEYQKKIPNIVYYGAYIDHRMDGVIAIHPTGKIYYLFYIDQPNCSTIGLSLLNHAIKELKPLVLNLSVPINRNLDVFLLNYGFMKQALSQHEMYLDLRNL